MAHSNQGIAGRSTSSLAGRTPGPLGFRDAADVNVPICFADDSPGPLGTGGDIATYPISKARKFKILLLDLEEMTRFLRSVAYAIEMESHTRITWKEYDEDVVINVIYSVFFWKGNPGTAVITQASREKIKASADARTEQLLRKFFAVAASGPEKLKKFLEDQKSVRQSAMSNLDTMIREVHAINQGVIAETSAGIKRLAGIKLGADLMITGIGLAGGGWAFVGVGVAYSVIKEFAKMDEADIVGVATVATGKQAAEKAGEAAADAAVPSDALKVDRWEAEAKAIRNEELIEKYQKESIGKGAKKKAKLNTKVRLRTAEKVKFQKAASPLRRVVAKTLSRVNVLFAIKDAADSIQEFEETWEASGP